MQLLEVRFYPRTKAVASGFVVVGKVSCDDQGACITPSSVRSQAVTPFDAGGLLAKLQFLVDAAPRSAAAPELLALRSLFWSFVDVTSGVPASAEEDSTEQAGAEPQGSEMVGKT